jgi:hypothetical protein
VSLYCTVTIERKPTLIGPLPSACPSVNCVNTVEVLEGNDVAQAAYRKFGFDDSIFDPAHGRMLFWSKPL